MVAVLFLQVNALTTILILTAFLAQGATALWDVSHVITARDLTPIEQHVHSSLEMIPLVGMVSMISMHWGQFLGLLGIGAESTGLDLTWKAPPLPAGYVVTLLTVILLFELLPYVEEFIRDWRHKPVKLRLHG
jgi:hypothetical protein